MGSFSAIATGEPVTLQGNKTTGPETAGAPETWKTEKLAGGLVRAALRSIEQAVLHPAPLEPFERPTVEFGIVACVLLEDP